MNISWIRRKSLKQPNKNRYLMGSGLNAVRLLTMAVIFAGVGVAVVQYSRASPDLQPTPTPTVTPSPSVSVSPAIMR